MTGEVLVGRGVDDSIGLVCLSIPGHCDLRSRLVHGFLAILRKRHGVSLDLSNFQTPSYTLTPIDMSMNEAALLPASEILVIRLRERVICAKAQHIWG